jgi:hypothetical protein
VVGVFRWERRFGLLGTQIPKIGTLCTTYNSHVCGTVVGVAVDFHFYLFFIFIFGWLWCLESEVMRWRWVVWW